MIGKSMEWKSISFLIMLITLVGIFSIYQLGISLESIALIPTLIFGNLLLGYSLWHGLDFRQIRYSAAPLFGYGTRLEVPLFTEFFVPAFGFAGSWVFAIYLEWLLEWTNSGILTFTIGYILGYFLGYMLSRSPRQIGRFPFVDYFFFSIIVSVTAAIIIFLFVVGNIVLSLSIAAIIFLSLSLGNSLGLSLSKQQIAFTKKSKFSVLLFVTISLSIFLMRFLLGISFAYPLYLLFE